jgi:type III secretion protein X
MATRIHDKLSPFPMDRGIEKISHRDEVRELDSGSSGAIMPADAALNKPRLDQLYAATSLGDYIASQLAPAIHDPSLLLPGRFNRAVQHAADVLNAAAEQDPRNARILQRAARILLDQASMRDLIKMYTDALLKG